METNSGFIQLHRKLTEWEWYDDISTFKLFIHCLLKANYKPKNWRGIDIKRGEFVTSISKLSLETGLSIKQVRSSIDKLVKTKELGKRTTSLNTCISVVQYDNYQNEGKRKANEGQTRGKRRATTNKDNKDNKENNNIDFFEGVDLNKKDILNKWIKYRQEIKKPLTVDSTIKALVNKINSFDLKKCEYTINNSIENNYQGLFWGNYKDTRKSNNDYIISGGKRIKRGVL